MCVSKIDLVIARMLMKNRVKCPERYLDEE